MTNPFLRAFRVIAPLGIALVVTTACATALRRDLDVTMLEGIDCQTCQSYGGNSCTKDVFRDQRSSAIILISDASLLPSRNHCTEGLTSCASGNARLTYHFTRAEMIRDSVGFGARSELVGSFVFLEPGRHYLASIHRGDVPHEHRAFTIGSACELSDASLAVIEGRLHQP
jgi:hypothetical protein